MTDSSGLGTVSQKRARSNPAKVFPGKKRLEKRRLATGVERGVDGVDGRKSADIASAPGHVGADEARAQMGS